MDCHFKQKNNKDEYMFGEWVLVDGEKSGQIIDEYDFWCMVDENGRWNKYPKQRLTKDDRYFISV